MKKYLLLFLMCVYASIGAWAENAVVTYYSNGGVKKLIVTTNDNPDLSSSNITNQVDYGGGATSSEYNVYTWDYTLVKIIGSISQTGLNFIQTNAQSSDIKFDMTQATANGVWMSFPEKASSVLLPSDASIPDITWGSKTQYVYSAASTGNDSYLYVANGITVSNVTELETSALSGSKILHITGPGAKAFKAELMASPYNVDGNNVDVPFDGSIVIDNNTAGSLQSAVEAELVAAGLTSSDKNRITSLTISGAFDDKDLTYISTLTGLTTLNLSAATGDVSNLASNSVTTLTLPTSATALPNNITTNLPSLSSPLYIYTADNNSKLTNLDIFLPVSGGIEAVINTIKNDLFGANAQWSTLQATNEAVVKVSGNLNSADITNIMAVASSCSTLDFSDATGITATDITGAHYVIKLPAGSEMPTDTQAANWNKGGGSADMIVYSISPNGKTISIWSNNVGTIASAITGSKAIAGYTGVDYALIVGKNGNNFSTDVTALTAKNINQALLPISYNGCEVTINKDFATSSMASLITEAENHLGSTNICTLKVTGELTTNDLESLDDAETATRIDLSEATVASGAINSLQVPSTLKSLVLPPGESVSSTLAARLNSMSNFEYVYSDSKDNGATTPTYVWIAKTGVMSNVFANESSLSSAVYLKVVAKEGVTLDQNSVDLSQTGMANLQYLDVSESGLTTAAAPYYKAPHWNPYRIILPNNWSGDDMATFAANKNVGAIAAVYSYHGTTLKIMEIIDASYSQAALADPRIMRSGTTEVDVVSGYYDGTTYAQFGTNLLAALNNMGKPSFSVTTKDANNNGVVTNYTNTVGQSVKTISIETTSAAPNALTFDNPSITTLKAENLVQNNAELNVSACSALTSLSVKGSNLKSVTANGNTTITSADFSGTAIATTTHFNGATSLATFNTTGESIFNGNVDLTSSALDAFTSEARFGGNINFNASSSLASIDLSGATFSNNTSVIHVDAETMEGEAIINDLQKKDGIKVPSSFANNVATRVHPYNASFVNVASPVASAYNITTTDMTFHDKEAGDNTDHYRYWYMGAADSQKILTLGTSDSRRLSEAIAAIPTEQNHSTTQYAKIKVVGPLTSADITSLKDLNCTALDLSEATSGETGENAKTIGELLKTSFSNTSTLGVHPNVKFIALPDSCTRDYILNEKSLAGLKNSVYCVIAVNETSEGKDLTSYSFQSGSLQPAVVAFQNSAANSWTKILSSETTPTTKYTSTVSNFKKLKISGLINSYDLSKGNQKLDADGHLSWAEDVVESTDQTRTLNGAYNVYGPFSACDLLTEIDLRDAYFEPKSGQSVEEGSVYYRYWYSDMTLSFLNVITTATYKVVIPQNSKVREIPADFMRCSTGIRAICIPSNIQAIRTRAFYTIDYVWTTADAYATTTSTADPEGNNTRLDNGAKLSDGKQVYAMKYDTGKHKYEENPAFLDSYYTADYSGDKGGGTYTFGSTLKLIETGAFANTQPNVSDVYVLNKIAPECHVDAFNTVMYTGNGGYNPTAVSKEGIITRAAYYNGRWITMLHYPRQTTDPQIQRYTDPTRDYSIATGMRDGKGAILYFPNQSEFIRAYQQGTFGYTWNAWNPTRVNGSVVNGSFNGSTNEWTAELQTAANDLFDAYTTGGDNHQYTSFYKVSDFKGVTAPKTPIVPYYQVNWSGSAYTTGNPGNLYPQSEIDKNNDADNSGEMTTKDYRGWHQFVLNAYAANTVLEEEPYRSYITDNEWWTICPEFDITRKEAILLFGTPSDTPANVQIPYVSKLRYVRREYSDPCSIYLDFSKNLMVYKENRTTSTTAFTRVDGEITAVHNASQHGEVNATTGIVEINTQENSVQDDDVVMSAGVPYLIKPHLPSNTGAIRQYRVFKNEDDATAYNAKKASTDPIGYASETLWAKIKFAQTISGNDQKAMIKTGTYTVPAFVSVENTASVTQEEVEKDGESPKKFSPLDGNKTEYYRSAVRHYTFVGTFYKSFLPHYSYFLGWDSSNNCAKFFYHNGNFTTIDNEMRWANGTGVIVPVLAKDLSDGKFNHSVTAAADMKSPAQWSLKDEFKDDSFTSTSGSGSAKQYSMLFNAPDLVAVGDSEVTGIDDVNAENNIESLGNADIYSVNGQKVGTSLIGLPKGIYIVNGKKFIVK